MSDENPAELRGQAEALLAEGKIPEATQAYRGVVRATKDAFGKDSAGHAAALYDLARVLTTAGKNPEAEELLRRAAAIFEATPGVTEVPYAHAVHSLASLLGAQDRFGEAEAVLRDALAKQEAALGPTASVLGPTLTNLAIVLVQRQELEQAEAIVRRSLAIVEEAHGEGHEETARVLTILAQIQATRGDAAAPETAKRALRSLTATYGDDHDLVKEMRPMLDEIAGSDGDADAALREAAEAMEAHDPMRAIVVLEPLVARAAREGLVPLEASAGGLLAQALYVTGRRDHARKVAQRSLELAESAGQEDAAAHFRELVAAVSGEGEHGLGLAGPLHDEIEAAIETARTGDLGAARTKLLAAAEAAVAADDRGAEATVRIVLAQILDSSGDKPGAVAELQRALAIAEQLGDEGAADHIRKMLPAS